MEKFDDDTVYPTTMKAWAIPQRLSQANKEFVGGPS